MEIENIKHEGIRKELFQRISHEMWKFSNLSEGTHENGHYIGLGKKISSARFALDNMRMMLDELAKYDGAST